MTEIIGDAKRKIALPLALRSPKRIAASAQFPLFNSGAEGAQRDGSRTRKSPRAFP
jgi:hypothetical protein